MIYDIAGLRVLIKNRYSFTDRFCSGYLASGDDYDLIAEVTREEFEEEKKSSEGFSDGYVENI